MTITKRPSAFTDLASFRDTMERLFDERLVRPMGFGTTEREIIPALDLYGTPEAIIARIALPGVKPENVDVRIDDDLVTVSGTFTEETEATEAGYVHRELSRGAFSRSFSIPRAVKSSIATATFKEGLLTLTLPKVDEVQPTHVKVEVV